jgi:rubrerythrin
MGIDVQEAIRSSIQTEKNAMYFYRMGAVKMKDKAARELFELLSREEREHAGHFNNIYQGGDIPSLDDFLNEPPDDASQWLTSISRLIENDFSEKKAMELAMEREKSLEEELQKTASGISDPEVRKVYEMNARETNNHYLMIESEYARIMAMVHETDMDTYVRE